MRYALLVLTLAVTLAAAKVSYRYDAAGRLSLVDYGDGNAISYTYDKAGNLLKRQATGGAAPATAQIPGKATPKKRQSVAKSRSARRSDLTQR
ncbi:MAG: RHS repeat protein [Acidobacteria bacterium]|nr:RHS repeat protein [Acidobacteriota bacterium]